MQDDVKKLLASVNRRKLRNNTQKVLFALLTARNEWVSRSSIRVPSVGARLRDLRKPQFGGFQVECVSASKLGKRTQTRRIARKGEFVRQGDNSLNSVTRSTYYRVNPNSVTVSRVAKVFEGVISAHQQ